MILHSLEFEIPLISCFFILILGINFFSKKRLRLKENKTYEMILLTSLFASTLDTVFRIITTFNPVESLKTKYFILLSILSKSIITAFIAIFAYLLCYTLIISYSKARKRTSTIFKCTNFFIFITIVISQFTQIEIQKRNGITEITGSTPHLAYWMSATLIFLNLSIILPRLKKKSSKSISLFFLLLTTIILGVLSLFFKSIILYDFILALLCYLMYFTIENPDLKLVEQLNLEKQRAEKASRAKSEFLSSVSHEIRTPLNAIVGITENLKNNATLTLTNQEDLADLSTAAQTLYETVGNILDISQIENERLTIKETIYSPQKSFTALYQMNQWRIENKNIHYTLSLAEDIPEYLYGDITHICQITNNLLSNAIKYTTKGQVNLRIEGQYKKDIFLLIIKVKDTGKGIKEQDQKKLFNKFERLDVPLNSNIQGMGLGLAIVKNLVKKLKGTIEVESTYQLGSTFTVTIPEKIAPSPSFPLEKQDQTPKIKKIKKILIVDDNRLNIKVAKKLLQDFPLEIDECYDGVECLNQLKEKHYDMILMDIMMPKLDGVKTLKCLKQKNSFNTPVIALTADAIMGSQEKYLKLGFTNYLAKPYTKDQLQEVITTTLNKQRDQE